MKQYIFQFSTHEESWEEMIEAKGMMDAFLKVKSLRDNFEQEQEIPVQIKYKTVRYKHSA